MRWTEEDVAGHRLKHPELPWKDAKPAKPVRRPKGRTNPAPAFDLFSKLLELDGLPVPETEFPFAEHLGRKFKFDYAWPGLNIALEKDGMVHRIRERHLSDLVKFRFAAALGWTVYHCRPVEMEDGRALALMAKVLRGDREGALQVLVDWGAEK